MRLQRELDPLSRGAAEPTLVDVRRAGMDLLAGREHSRAELSGKLAKKGFPEELIQEALDGLHADGLQCDRRFAEAFSSGRARRGQGPVHIAADLRERGVDDVLIGEAIAGTGADWLSLAREVREKRFGSESPKDFKERARQARFLTYRGFDAEHVQAALD